MYTSKTGFVKADFDPKSIITIPNILSFVRLLILPFIFILLCKGKNIWAFVLLLFAGFTDVLDGYLAKILNQATTFGKIIDPVVDKIFTLSILVFLTNHSDFPLTALLIILFLELLILFGGTILIKKHNIIPSSNVFGKVAIVFISVMIYMYILDFDLFNSKLFFSISLQDFFMFVGIVSLFFAIISYAINAINKLKEKKI